MFLFSYCCALCYASLGSTSSPGRDVSLCHSTFHCELTLPIHRYLTYLNVMTAQNGKHCYWQTHLQTFLSEKKEKKNGCKNPYETDKYQHWLLNTHIKEGKVLLGKTWGGEDKGGLQREKMSSAKVAAQKLTFWTVLLCISLLTVLLPGAVVKCSGQAFIYSISQLVNR